MTLLNDVLFLVQHGAEVKVVPWNYDYSKDEYDGLFLSNGPGDPALAEEAILNLRKVIYKYKTEITSLTCKGPLCTY